MAKFVFQESEIVIVHRSGVEVEASQGRRVAKYDLSSVFDSSMAHSTFAIQSYIK